MDRGNREREGESTAGYTRLLSEPLKMANSPRGFSFLRIGFYFSVPIAPGSACKRKALTAIVFKLMTVAQEELKDRA